MLATKEKSHPGFQLPTPALHLGSSFAISNTATEFDAALYDFRIGPLCSGYFRDAETGLDYAVNRYHQPGMGRFLTPDPYMASGGPADPGSWNRYAYTRGDPINFNDPGGQCDVSVVSSTFNGQSTGSPAISGSSCGALDAFGDAGLMEIVQDPIEGGGGGSGGDPTPPPPCGPDNPGGVTLSSAQTALLGGMSYGSLSTEQQKVFLTITADAAAIGIDLSSFTLSSITIAGSRVNGRSVSQTELNLSGGDPKAFNSLTGFTCYPDDLVGRPHGGFTSNCRQDGLTNSLQINSNDAGNAQLDIDPFNPANGLVGLFDHFFGQVMPNKLSGRDTNYTNVANALQSQGITVFRCP